MLFAPLQPVTAAQYGSARRAAAIPRLMKAAQKGNVNDASKLIEAGADAVLEIDGNGNALIAAVRPGNREMIEYLASQGADPTACVPGDESALVAAAEAEDRELLRLLLEAE